MSKKSAGKKAAKAAQKAQDKAKGKAKGKPPLIALPAPEPLDLPIMSDSGPAQQPLAQARTRWEHGDWQSLLSMDPDVIADDPDRARLALILAAAHSHAGKIEQARKLAALALGWGASRPMAARVLLSAAQNSLARVAAALEEDPTPHFEAAIRLVQPHADIPLVARSRRVRELATMGLLPEAAAALEQELGLSRLLPERQTEDWERLQGQLAELRDLISVHHPAARSGKPGKPTLVIAGVPRSGSTWLYNVTRLLLEHAGKRVFARWHADYVAGADEDADIHVVKVHSPSDLTFPYSQIFTTNRNVVERVASLVRMGWVTQNENAVRRELQGQGKLYQFWRRRSDLEIDYDLIVKWPERAIQQIAEALGVHCDPTVAEGIEREMGRLRQPEIGEKPDQVTQLHPQHRSDGQKTAEIVAWIRDTVQDLETII